jgi:hypothetical protein
MNGRLLIAACLVIILVVIGIVLYQHKPTPVVVVPAKREALSSEQDRMNKRLLHYGTLAKNFAAKNRYSNNVCFLVDMRLHSGKNRFFIYDLQSKKTIKSGLVAHGSCNTSYQVTARFSNTPNCGCSSEGKYKVGYSYNGQFGKAFKLHGLDSTNNNAFRRFVVLHGYECVPDEETFPAPICNSLGCPMVSNKFLEDLAIVISKEKKPILLWMFQ